MSSVELPVEVDLFRADFSGITSINTVVCGGMETLRARISIGSIFWARLRNFATERALKRSSVEVRTRNARLRYVETISD